jgi:hypothetical protein
VGDASDDGAKRRDGILGIIPAHNEKKKKKKTGSMHSPGSE